MAVIWTIECSENWTENNQNLCVTRALLGNYPVRAFASFESFQKVASLGSSMPPHIMIVDLDICSASMARIYNVINVRYPSATVLFLTSSEELVPSNLAGRKAIIIQKPASIFTIKHLVESVFEKSSRMPRCIEFGNLVVDLDQGEAFLKGHDETIGLTPREFKILRTLVHYNNKTLTRDVLIEKAWGGVKVSPRTIDSQISRLRKRIEESTVSIKSIYGGGYCLFVDG